MLYVHDTYAVMGEREFDFEDAVRESYASAVADDDTRFVRYLQSVHSSAEGYLVVMLTALRDGDALDRLVRRLRYGDLSAYFTHISSMRYQARSLLLVRADWAGGPDLDLASVPVGDTDHAAAFFREDALEGKGINAALSTLASHRAPSGDAVLTLEAAFQPALDTDTAARVLYRLADKDRLTAAWATDAGWGDWPGSLMPDLPDGVRGSGRYLRSARWSPL